MTIPEVVRQQADANWWIFTHVSAPLILIGLVVYGIIAYIYQTYYDN
jgi:hypothetical protein